MKEKIDNDKHAYIILEINHEQNAIQIRYFVTANLVHHLILYDVNIAVIPRMQQHVVRVKKKFSKISGYD
jgi:hypothetical protein